MAEMPTVRVNALALRNLSALPFLQLRASGGSAPPALAARARWLEPGLGAAQALTAAATAALAESLPSVLVAPVRRTQAARKEGAPPAIWVFGAEKDVNCAVELVGAAFERTQKGVWTFHSPKGTTDALFDAVSSAIVAALEADGALRVGEDVVHPAVGLSYRFKLAISQGVSPTVVLRVSVHDTDVRYVDDDDTAAILATKEPAKNPIHVVASPLALQATLSKRRLAGDALSASVLARWREAGLLPAAPLKDCAVLFLDLGRGLEVPFPRACVLTSAKKGHVKASKPAARGRERVPKPDVLIKSRKRPRSPFAAVDKPVDQSLAASAGNSAVKEQVQLQPKKENHIIEEAPALTAASFNAALVDAGRNGLVDAYPVFKHPFARNPSRPQPLQEIGTPGKAEGNTAANPEADGQAKPGTGLLAATEINNSRYNGGNDLDMFGMMGSSRADANMDMDFGDLAEDVTQFFGDITTPNHASSPLFGTLGGEKAGAGSSANPNPRRSPTANAAFGLEKSRKNGLGVSGKRIDKRKHTSGLRVVAKVMETFASIPSPQNRPSADDRGKAIAEFLETNCNKKMTESLVAGMAPSQRFSQNVISPIDSQFMPSYTKYGSIEGVRSLLAVNGKSKVKADEKLKSLRHMYVPTRRLEAYARMARKNKSPGQRARAMQRQYSYSDLSSDEESDSEPDCEMGRPDKTISRYQQKIEAEAVACKDDENVIDAGAASKVMDASKVAETVAVDCASACLVLIEEYQRSVASSASVSSRTATLAGLSAGGAGAVAVGGVEGDKSPALTASAPPAVGVTPSTTQSPKVNAPLNPIPQRMYASRPKKERDNSKFLSFLALLQMQSMSVDGLHIFDINAPATLSDHNAGGQMHANGTGSSLMCKPINTVPASTAVLRRALHGLPRTIECSKALRSYTMTDGSGQNGETLRVDGPLAMSELYGENTTVQALASPQICVGHNKTWFETTGHALPLWEKCGFEPYSERKHVEFTVLAPKAVEHNTKVFFSDLSAAYEECGLGRHTSMSSEHIALIPSSRAKAPQTLKAWEVSPEEDAMITQYTIFIASLNNKLRALKQQRDTSESSLVVYIVSPFLRGRDAANAKLLTAASALLTVVSGAVGSSNGLSTMGLPTTAWRLPASQGSFLSLHVRIIPQEAMDRKLSTWMQSNARVGVPKRPQLAKALAFSIYGSLKSKILRSDVGSGKESVGSSNALSPDDQMSPMTPDFVGDVPPAISISPHSPVASNAAAIAEDGAPSAHPSSAASVPAGITVDQSSALAPSYLHEPAVVLAGIGSQVADLNSPASIVLHLAYGFCREASRYLFSWTDVRGELLDSASVPVGKNGISSSRRRAFWYMWQRGQRWKLPYVDAVHVTVTKVGDMEDGEADDWDIVLSTMLSVGSNVGAKAPESDRARLVRRFPSIHGPRQMEGMDGYIDHPTPATPAAAPSGRQSTSISDSPTRPAVDHGIKSVSLICLRDTPRERLVFDAAEASTRQDFMVVAGSTFAGDKHAQGKAVLGRVDKDGVTATEVDLVLHFGSSNRGALEKEAQKWDGNTPSDIVRSVVGNFHALCFVVSPPCWPEERWRCRYPLHVEVVRNFRNSLRIAWTPKVFRGGSK